ncbi:A-kinase anchor protein 5 [Podarcis lilfordi]|uniref:A-kinase anchor protein 5 n=1 Tax=Podarcis lilfordi TaxID=74358 RepID=A0AA35JRC5_9SAUR|nr:A-kinase anchor protein 5 [Podarcis lilfordi]
MEDTTKEIQTESMQEPEASNAEKPFLSHESPAQKASAICFKRRKKSYATEKDEDRESVTRKATNQLSNSGQSQMEASDPPWTSGGAWLSFKRLVTLRRRSKSALKKQAQSGSRVQLETNVENSGAKERTSSNHKIPCLRFCRSKKSCQAEITEEGDHGEKASEGASIVDNKRNSEPESVSVEGPLNADQSPGGALENKGNRGVVNNSEEVAPARREDAFSEMSPGPDQYTDFTAQSEIIHSETVLETEQEKQLFQLHHGSLYGEPEEGRNERFDFEGEVGSLLAQDLPESQPNVLEGEDSKNSPAKEAELEQSGEDAVPEMDGAKEGNSVEVLLHCSLPVSEDEASQEPNCPIQEAESDENKLAMPGAGIVIMITEAEAFQEEEEEEPSYSCETFSFPQASKQKAKKKTSKVPDSRSGREGKACPQAQPPLGANDQEHWASEQYEVLLIETAASLVKAAIQSSIEQLVNEMALEQNKQNSFL